MELAEIKVDDKGGKFHLLVSNQMTAFRAKSFWTKEPHTIEWLRAIEPTDLLWDIGANVGVYTLFAAARGVPVMAFEPESQNFGMLNANIYYNRLSGLATAYPLAIGKITDIGDLYLTQFMTGGSCHQFGDKTSFSGEKEMHADFRQGSMCLRAATVAELTGRSPTHVKIDVDGHEPDVVEGLMGLPGLKSLIIETNWNRQDHKDMVDLLESEGFTWNQEQADGAKRKDGAFKDCGETIFTAGDCLQDRQYNGEDVAVSTPVH